MSINLNDHKTWEDVFIPGTNELHEPYRGIDNDYWLHYQLKPGDIFVEAGAHFGRTLTVGAAHVKNVARIVLIEPAPDSLKILKRHTEGRRVNVDIVEKALSNKRGISKMWVAAGHLPPANWSGDRLVEVLDQGNNGSFVDVQIDTLDNIATELALPQINLLGWDIEGAGNLALEGCEMLLREHKIWNLALDCSHAPEHETTTIKVLESYGYRIVASRPGFVYATCE